MMEGKSASLKPNVTRGAILILLVTFVCGPTLLNAYVQDDTWRHLALGRLFWALKGLPHVQPYGFMIKADPFIDFSWFTCLAFYGVYSLFSESGLIVLSAGVSAFTWASRAFQSTPAEDSPTLFTRRASAVLITALVAALALRWRVAARPEIFGIFFLFAFISLHERRRFGMATLAVLLWNNFHATASLALVCAALLDCGSLIFDKRAPAHKGLPLLAYTAALFVNPWGARLVKESIWQAFEPLNRSIAEFMPSYAFTWSAQSLVAIALPVVAMGYALVRERGSRRYSLLFIFFLFLAVKYARCVPYLVILALPWLRKSIESLLARSRNERAASIFLAGSLWCGALLSSLSTEHGLNFEKQDYQNAIDLLVSSPVHGNVLNDFGMGGYLMWSAPGKLDIFIDNRSPLYVKTSMPLYFNIWDIAVCENILQTYNIQAVILPMTGACSNLFSGPAETSVCGAPITCFKKSQWALVDWTKEAVLLVRKAPDYASWLAPREYRWVNPFPPTTKVLIEQMEQSTRVPGGRENLQQELQRAAATHPGDERILQMIQIFKSM